MVRLSYAGRLRQLSILSGVVIKHFMKSVVMLSVVHTDCCDYVHYAECHYADCRCALSSRVSSLFKEGNLT